MAYGAMNDDIVAAATLLRRLPAHARRCLRPPLWRRLPLIAAAIVMLAVLLSLPQSACALDVLSLATDVDVVDITDRGIYYEDRGDRLQVETAPGADGITGRMAVRAANPGSNPHWLVFALSNPGRETVERWLTAPRYSLNGSQFFNPDLDKGRIIAVTPSMGYRPERIPSDATDIFRLSLEPGAVVTFVAELSGDTFPRLSLWKVGAFEKKRRNSYLFNGILIGVTGIIAVMLTALFAANHKAMFPAGALVIWTGLAYLCVEFGFWHHLFNLSADGNATYRAASEAAFATSLVVFLYIFLSLRLWHNWVKLFFVGWILAQVMLFLLAFFNPPLAASLARLSFAAIGLVGSLFILYLALRGQSRALSLMPVWLLFLVWLFGVAVTLLGLLSGDMVVTAMNAGLVLLLALFGFTVTQFAFRGREHTGGGPADRYYSSSQAIDGSGASVWFFDARHETINIGEELEEALGLSWGTLSGPLDNWLDYLHPTDRERFQLMLIGLKERNGGAIDIEFRMRRSDGNYLWYALKAHTDDWIRARTLNCVGLLHDITSSKRAQERLMHDAVHDSLTGLPNRQLFFDRLATALIRAGADQLPPPVVLVVDIDGFKNINNRFGIGVGDTMLLTVSRRLARYLRPQDSLARIGGDQFAIMMLVDPDPAAVLPLAERIRKALRAPIAISGEEVILTSSVGVAINRAATITAEEAFREAEVAMYRAKRLGADRIELFRPEMLAERDNWRRLESELRQAVERGQLELVYQPIMRLTRNELVGFEALLRWNHPKFGRIGPEEFIPIAEENGSIGELGAFVLDQAVKEAATWHRIVPMGDRPLFVSVNVSSAQLFREDLVADIRHIMTRQNLSRGVLRLEITETLVMSNPEQAIGILQTLKALGVGLSMDDFGSGYSSLGYLLRFPFDTIKVDREIVRHRDNEKAGAVILRSIVALAHELDKDVVAEGIETEQDAAYLRSIRCDFAQGFYFGEPMESREVHFLLKALVKAGKLSLDPPQRSDESLGGKPLEVMRAILPRVTGAARPQVQEAPEAPLPPQPPRPAVMPPAPGQLPATMPAGQPRGRPSPAQSQSGAPLPPPAGRRS